MFFQPRIYTGLSLTCDGRQLQGLSLIKQRKKLVISNITREHIAEGVVRPAFSAANIHDMAAFTTVVKKALRAIAPKENRVALCLPDLVAQTSLVDLETSGLKANHIEKQIRWKLRETIKATGEYTLAINHVGASPQGMGRYLVGVMDSAVLSQYQQAIQQTGYDVVLCDLHSLALTNHLCQQESLQGEYLLVTVTDGQLGLLVHDGCQPQYCRWRRVDGDEEQLAHELQRSFLAARQVYPDLQRLPVYYYCATSAEQVLNSLLIALCSSTPINISGQLKGQKSPIAYCAAERLACGWR